MSEIKTITATSTEQEITLDATYQFMWFRNLGDNDCYVSDHSGIIAGADDVALCKAGECVRITLPQAPMSNKAYIKAVDGSNTVEIHAQNFSDKPTAKTGKGSGGGSQIVVEALTVDTNGVYTAPTGKAYSPVTVDVQEQPWQPLEDGYSNFWFELSNDTLSPWLNFSAKNAGATIDWGDGSGEQALTALTPTHTYAKAGKYVVKVKGVTSMGAAQQQSPLTEYIHSLRYVEFNNELTTASATFRYCVNLKKARVSSVSTFGVNVFQACTDLVDVGSINATNIPVGLFYNAFSLKNISLLNTISIEASAFSTCTSLREIILPSTVTSIGNSAFSNCSSLTEIHIQATTPPTLGTNVFQSLPSNYVIYVPVGTSETYKAASGWSTYADHILEEGQTPNRMMLAKFNSDNTDNEEMR